MKEIKKELLGKEKIVNCNDDECLHYRELKERVRIFPRKNYEPLGDEDCWVTGFCDRDQIVIDKRVISTLVSRYNLTVCKYRSDKDIAGHRDFTKMMPQFVDEDGMKEYNKSKKRKIF